MSDADLLAAWSSMVIACAIWVVSAKLGWPPLRVFNAIQDGLRWLVTPRKVWRDQRIAEIERELGIDP